MLGNKGYKYTEYYSLFFTATMVKFRASMLRYTYTASLVILLIFRYQNRFHLQRYGPAKLRVNGHISEWLKGNADSSQHSKHQLNAHSL
jgi:hypothetical protein